MVLHQGVPPNKQMIITIFVEPCHFHLWNSSKKYFILHMGKLMFRIVRLQIQGHVTKWQAETEPHLGLPGSKSWDLSTMEDSCCRLLQVRWKKCMVKCHNIKCNCPKRQLLILWGKASRLSSRMSQKMVLLTSKKSPTSEKPYIWHLDIANLKRDPSWWRH